MPEEISVRTRRLVDVAMGRKPADLVIRNGRWVCVQTGEIIPNTDIAISGEYIAFIGQDATHTIGKETRLIEADGSYLVPGLLDGHMHVEGGNLTVTEFVQAIVPYGTTGIFIDPHEMANVLGLKGVKLMVDEAALQPIHVWVQMPSCVPSAPGMETPGASIGPEDVAEAMKWPGIIGLGEMMNFPGVSAGDVKMHAEMAEARRVGKVISGHYASPDLGNPFHAFVVGGPEDDHEGTSLEDAVERARQGMKPMLRAGSGWLDVAEGIRAITEMKLDPRHFILCTDDSHADTLVNEGHVDRALREAIRNGVNPLTAIQMATLNTAEHFGVARDVGQIAPGRFADILLVKDLTNFHADQVIAKGELVADRVGLKARKPEFRYPEWAVNSVHLGKPLTPVDFILKGPAVKSATANVIGVVEGQILTRHLQMDVVVVNGEVPVDLRRDILKISVVERHKATGRVQVGLVHGFGFNCRCAVATTLAHDSHNMVIVGSDEEDMAIAANRLAELKGGQIVMREGEVIAELGMPIAGLMSNLPAAEVAKQAAEVLKGFEQCGCKIKSPNMALSFLALVVIPELRISDLGLVDVNKFQFVPVFEGTY